MQRRYMYMMGRVGAFRLACIACFACFLFAPETLWAKADVSAAGDDVVTYETMVVAKKGTDMLALYNTLSDPVDNESLQALARHCYGEVSGNLYGKVLISWYLPGQSKGTKPWAVSNFSSGIEVIEILDEALVKQFPSVKRWQQPGHDPL